jgi:hypothetical protein
MSSKSLTALKWVASAFMGSAGAWSWAIWLGVGAAATAGALAWHAGQVHTAVKAAEKRGAAPVQARWDKSRVEVAEAVATAHRENARELSRLVQVNQEVQGAYNTILASVADADRSRAAGAGLRNAERAAIVAAAQRAASDACGRYAEAAERDLERSETDTDRFGHEAVRASAAAHALNSTLLARRDAAAARRSARTGQDTLKPTQPEIKQ